MALAERARVVLTFRRTRFVLFALILNITYVRISIGADLSATVGLLSKSNISISGHVKFRVNNVSKQDIDFVCKLQVYSHGEWRNTMMDIFAKSYLARSSYITIASGKYRDFTWRPGESPNNYLPTAGMKYRIVIYSPPPPSGDSIHESASAGFTLTK